MQTCIPVMATMRVSIACAGASAWMPNKERGLTSAISRTQLSGNPMLFDRVRTLGP